MKRGIRELAKPDCTEDALPYCDLKDSPDYGSCYQSYQKLVTEQLQYCKWTVMKSSIGSGRKY